MKTQRHIINLSTMLVPGLSTLVFSMYWGRLLFITKTDGIKKMDLSSPNKLTPSANNQSSTPSMLVPGLSA